MAVLPFVEMKALPKNPDHLISFFTPRNVLRSIVGLAGFALRRPGLAAGLFLQGLRDRKAMAQFLRLPIDLETIRRSPLFDRDWYLRNHPELSHGSIPPELHYLLHRVPDGRHASPRFSGDAYFEQNPELRLSGLNPLVHYEQYGRFTGLPASILDARPPPIHYPESAIETELQGGIRAAHHRRTAIFAVFTATGRLPETDLLYLQALQEVVDNIVVVGNCPILPEEEERLRPIAAYSLFRRHGGYDFGSYRLGLALAENAGLLAAERCDELVFANDSCYAVLPFSPMFDAMKMRPCDFWGLTENDQLSAAPHVQSFFLVFRRRILETDALPAFFDERPAQVSRRDAILLYETQLTDDLHKRGFSHDTFVPRRFLRLHSFNPTTLPIVLMQRYGVPVVKAKALRGETREPPEKVLAYIRRKNPPLGALLAVSAPPSPRSLSADDLASAWEPILSRIRIRLQNGQPARVVFLVASAAMFPARPLFEAMRRAPDFHPTIAVIPDLRWPGRPLFDNMAVCEAELFKAYPDETHSPLRPNDGGDWPDVFSGADFAVYPSPYDFSNFRYNPQWAIGRGFLPIYISYSFSTSIFGHGVLGRQNYAYFWKVFVECDATAKEYAEHSVLRGANAEVAGYFKMDALASAEPWPRNGNRKRVLIAPHHSVDGGANDTLALSNFQRYADYFLALPEKHPELDFVFRPHPFLFTVLSQPSKWGQARVDGWIARMRAHPNVRWSDEGDYFPAFASCDAIVQDCGSYLAEWVYTGKPCCYMLKTPSDINAKFTPLGRECLSHCYLAYDETAIESFLAEVVEGGSDPKASARDAFRKTVMVNYPHAADAALRSIRRELTQP